MSGYKRPTMMLIARDGGRRSACLSPSGARYLLSRLELPESIREPGLSQLSRKPSAAFVTPKAGARRHLTRESLRNCRDTATQPCFISLKRKVGQGCVVLSGSRRHRSADIRMPRCRISNPRAGRLAPAAVSTRLPSLCMRRALCRAGPVVVPTWPFSDRCRAWSGRSLAA